MPKFIVTKTFQYVEEVEIEAETAEAAKELAVDMTGKRVDHDTLVESVVRRAAD